MFVSKVLLELCHELTYTSNASSNTVTIDWNNVIVLTGICFLMFLLYSIKFRLLLKMICCV